MICHSFIVISCQIFYSEIAKKQTFPTFGKYRLSLSFGKSRLSSEYPCCHEINQCMPYDKDMSVSLNAQLKRESEGFRNLRNKDKNIPSIRVT